MEEQKFQLLPSDYIDIRHPSNKNKIVRLYRIISLKEIKNPYRHVNAEEIGGYVQSLDNLSNDDTCWISGTAKVFGNAVVSDNSFITDDAYVYEDAKITGQSLIQHRAHIRGSSELVDCHLMDKTDVRGNSSLEDVVMENSSLIYGSCDVSGTTLSGGSMIHGEAKVYGSDLKDVSEVKGDAVVRNCKLSGRAVLYEGVHENESFYRDVELNVTIGK